MQETAPPAPPAMMAMIAMMAMMADSFRPMLLLFRPIKISTNLNEFVNVY
jgi:hypothetical protein